jgi:hypothetical protein
MPQPLIHDCQPVPFEFPGSDDYRRILPIGLKAECQFNRYVRFRERRLGSKERMARRSQEESANDQKPVRHQTLCGWKIAGSTGVSWSGCLLAHKTTRVCSPCNGPCPHSEANLPDQDWNLAFLAEPWAKISGLKTLFTRLPAMSYVISRELSGEPPRWAVGSSR